MYPLSGMQYMLLATLFFSGMNVCVKLLPAIPTHEIVFFRSLGMLTLVVFTLRKRKLDFEGTHRQDLMLRGLFGTCALLAYFYTLKNVGFAPAVTIQYLSPVFATVLAIFILGESVKPFQWFFFAVSCAGVWLVKGFSTSLAPQFLVSGLLAAFFSGLAYNYVRKLKGREDPQRIIFYFSWITLLGLGPYTLMNWQWPQGREWLLLGLVGLLTYVAQVCMTLAYQSERMAVVSNLRYLGLVYALVLGYTLFGEEVAAEALLGMLLIVISVVLGSNEKLVLMLMGRSIRGTGRHVDTK